MMFTGMVDERREAEVSGTGKDPSWSCAAASCLQYLPFRFVQLD
jgi:hypothetical protein